MLLCMSVLATVLRMLSFLFAAAVVFWMFGESEVGVKG